MPDGQAHTRAFKMGHTVAYVKLHIEKELGEIARHITVCTLSTIVTNSCLLVFEIPAQQGRL